MSFFDEVLAAAYQAGRSGEAACRGMPGQACAALVPDRTSRSLPRLVLDGGTIFLETSVPSGFAGWTLLCRVPADPQAVPQLQQAMRRGVNDRRYAQMIAGLVLLLALCGWVAGGEDVARRLAEEAARAGDGSVLAPELMWQRFRARQLEPADWPALFAILHALSQRAALPRPPDLYCIAEPSMNAYALGGPPKSAITLTEGLLRGMSPDEISGILAHEIAHIASDDTGAMALAASLHRAIALAAHIGLVSLARRGMRATAALEALFGGAATIAHLLFLALSRLQETDADGLAAELIGDPRLLIAALHKLECHHTGVPPLLQTMPERDFSRYLRSHPATEERVGMLLGVAC